MSPDIAEEKIETSQHKLRNWILGGVIVFLLLVVQGLYTFSINSAGLEMRETNRNLTELLSTVRLHEEQIKDLKESRKMADATDKTTEVRLSSLETRAALHDQWIQAHNH